MGNSHVPTTESEKFEPSDYSKNANIKKVYNFDFIKAKDQKVKSTLTIIRNKLSRSLNSCQTLKEMFANK